MTATSPYLNRPLRSLAQARADYIELTNDEILDLRYGYTIYEDLGASFIYPVTLLSDPEVERVGLITQVRFKANIQTQENNNIEIDYLITLEARWAGPKLLKYVSGE